VCLNIWHLFLSDLLLGINKKTSSRLPVTAAGRFPTAESVGDGSPTPLGEGGEGRATGGGGAAGAERGHGEGRGEGAGCRLPGETA